MKTSTKALGLVAALAGAVNGRPAGRTLGSSFGIPGVETSYDYVIVGGGNAGLVIASRLVEQNAGSVAVIEAGTFYELGNGNTSEVPANSAFAGKDPNDWEPRSDWGYTTIPQAGAHDDILHYPRGKMLGGCTGRNYMIYQRGTIGSYDKWAEEVEDDSYTFENLLPWFEKSLNFTPPNMEYRGQNATPEFDTSALGTRDGYLSVTYPNYAYSFPTWSVSALKEIGMNVIAGFQNGKLMGQSWALFTIDAESQTRESSETAFLRRSLENTNYYLYDMTMAKKIIFDDSKKATGVLVDTLGMEYTLTARKEVILSAGAIGSPQLLQVSGVGPAELLEQNNIPIVSDLPGVGQNMQDHILFGITHRVNTLTASTVIQDAEFAAEQNRLFVEEARGTPTSPGMDILGWEKFPDHVRRGMSNRTLGILKNEYPEDWPEIEYITLSSYLGDFWNPGTADPRDGNNYATFSVLMTTPRSRGSVNITSSDTLKQPDINPNYLTDRADVDVAVAGFKRARDFWKTEAIAELTDPEEAYPGSAVQSDEEIEENIRKSFQTVFHGSCTCAMGPESNPRAVIDTRARVYGVQNLRVVDASSFPFLPPGHPQSTIYALAEKIACDIAGNC